MEFQNVSRIRHVRREFRIMSLTSTHKHSKHRYVTFILGSISLLYLFVNLSLCYDWPMRDKGPSIYYTGSTGSCGEMYFNETCFEENKEHVYVYYRWHIGFHVLSCIGFFTGFTMLKSRRCRSRVFNFETQRESNIWQYYAFCLNLYVANVYMELHNFLVQEYNQYSNRVGFSLGVGFATTIITMATFSNLRMWFAVSSIWISTIHLCILYVVVGARDHFYRHTQMMLRNTRTQVRHSIRCCRIRLVLSSCCGTSGM